MRLLLVVLLALLGACSVARAYCSEPSPPSCASEYGAFDDESDFEICRDEMETYKGEVEEYAECNLREARRKNDEAIDQFNDAVADFNSRARQ